MTKINFQNLPDTTTPVNASNLNQLQTNVENAIDGINSTLSSIPVPALSETTGVTTETTLLNTTITNAGTYLFFANIPINYYGQEGRELYIRFKVDNTEKWYNVGVVNTYIYTLSTALNTVCELPANANIKITLLDITGKPYACSAFNLYYLKLK